MRRVTMWSAWGLAGGIWATGLASPGLVIWLLGASPRTAVIVTLAIALPLLAVMTLGARARGDRAIAWVYVGTMVALGVLGGLLLGDTV